MENIPNNNTFNENIQNNTQAQYPNQNPQQYRPVFNAPQYNGQYANPGYNPAFTNTQGAPYTPPTAYNTPQYTPANTQQYGVNPNTAYTGPYTQTAQQSPSAIYNNTHTGNIPQYHYGNPNFGGIIDNRYYQEHQQKMHKRRENEKKIRSIGNISGLALIACFIIASVFSSLIFLPGISDIYQSGLGGQSIINLFYSVIVIGGTFFALGQILKKTTDKGIRKPKYNIDVKLNAPKDPIKAVLLILISFGGCMLANFFTSIITTFFDLFGISSGYSSLQDPKGITDLILMCIGTAVIPPLIEEYAMRGVLMSSLRKYGNVFAIVGSAYIFGIFHGNFSQIPFAFICGLFFGYAVIASDSLWTGIIIHALNNALSCISSVLIQTYDENVGNTFFYVCSVSGIILGVLALIIYIMRYKNDGVLKYKGDAEELPTKTKIAKFLKSPAMIGATAIYLLEAILMMTTSSVTT